MSLPDPKPSLVWPIVDELPPERIGIFSIARHVATHPATGSARTFTVLNGVPWINVVALTPDDRVVLVRQFRHGVRRLTDELPGGLVERGEDPLTAAIRELREETGYAAPLWKRLGQVDANPAIQSNQCTTFLALDAIPVGPQSLDEGEAIEVLTLPIAEVPEAIASGRLTHTLVLSGLLHLCLAAGGWRRPEAHLA